MRRAIFLLLAILVAAAAIILLIRSTAEQVQDTVNGETGGIDDIIGGGCENGESAVTEFTEADFTLRYPCHYEVQPTNEVGRRGTFAAYDFMPAANVRLRRPILKEIQFFSSESIAEFEENCDQDESPCFFGAWHTTQEYENLKNAYEQISDFGVKHMLVFRDKNYLVNSMSCESDNCAIREYTFFVDDVMIDLWIEMDSIDQQEAADQLFGMLIVE